MAEYDSGGEDSGSPGWKVVGFIILILLVGTLLERNGWAASYRSFNDSRDGTEEPLSLNSIFPSGDIELGDRIINKSDVIVRDQPGGDILGMQEVRATAYIIEGPEDAFNKEWWRVDYEKAPDGWVSKGDISNNVFWFRAFNIIPISLGFLRPILILISLIAIALIIWISFKMKDLNKIRDRKIKMKEEQKYAQESTVHAEEEGTEEIDNLPTGDDAPKTEDVHNRRWANVQSLINSHSVNDWRQAIIEADIILEEMLDKMGYKGDSIGDKLKTVEKSDFITLNKAWEAHKIRNRIAHKGSDYILTKDEAEQAIGSYAEVFKEFYFI